MSGVREPREPPGLLFDADVLIDITSVADDSSP